MSIITRQAETLHISMLLRAIPVSRPTSINYYLKGFWSRSSYRQDVLPAAQPTASKHWRHDQTYIAEMYAEINLNTLLIKEATRHKTFW